MTDPRGGEDVLLELHTHPKAMVLPALLFIALAAVLGLGIGWMPPAAEPFGTLALVIVVAAVAIVFVVRPWVVWRSRSYTVTDRRVIARHGVLRRQGREVAINRIVTVESDRGLLDRLLGCGTLRLVVPEGEIVLDDVPRVKEVQATINDLVTGGIGVRR